MANRATVTYNGKTISTEDRDGSFAVTYNGATIATIGAGTTKTLKCSGKLMKTNVVVGGKTLKCAKYKMATDVVIAVASLFPSSPSAYNLIGTYNSSGSFTAPSTGYFQIELQGASGKGGKGNMSSTYINRGGGGGGGGCAISRVKMNKGDTVIFSLGAANNNTSTAATKAGDSTATINSSVASYSALSVTGANNGYDGRNSGKIVGAGGPGGVGSGGNYANYTGGTGSTPSAIDVDDMDTTYSGVAGGAAGYSGGRTGGTGSGWNGKTYTHINPTAGSNAFIKIYAGNTNA